VKMRPSEGIRVEASVLARLLGIRLLKVDASVLVFPSDAPASRSASPDLLARPSRLSSKPQAQSRAVAGRRLADAVRSINEGAELLAEARRDGS
jgi:hypothetical protein